MYPEQGESLGAQTGAASKEAAARSGLMSTINADLKMKLDRLMQINDTMEKMLGEILGPRLAAVPPPQQPETEPISMAQHIGKAMSALDVQLGRYDNLVRHLRDLR